MEEIVSQNCIGAEQPEETAIAKAEVVEEDGTMKTEGTTQVEEIAQETKEEAPMIEHHLSLDATSKQIKEKETIEPSLRRSHSASAILLLSSPAPVTASNGLPPRPSSRQKEQYHSFGRESPSSWSTNDTGPPVVLQTGPMHSREIHPSPLTISTGTRSGDGLSSSSMSQESEDCSMSYELMHPPPKEALDASSARKVLANPSILPRILCFLVYEHEHTTKEARTTNLIRDIYAHALGTNRDLPTSPRISNMYLPLYLLFPPSPKNGESPNRLAEVAPSQMNRISTEIIDTTQDKSLSVIDDKTLRDRVEPIEISSNDDFNDEKEPEIAFAHTKEEGEDDQNRVQETGASTQASNGETLLENEISETKTPKASFFVEMLARISLSLPNFNPSSGLLAHQPTIERASCNQHMHGNNSAENDDIQAFKVHPSTPNGSIRQARTSTIAVVNPSDLFTMFTSCGEDHVSINEDYQDEECQKDALETGNNDDEVLERLVSTMDMSISTIDGRRAPREKPTATPPLNHVDMAKSSILNHHFGITDNLNIDNNRYGVLDLDHNPTVDFQDNCERFIAGDESRNDAEDCGKDRDECMSWPSQRIGITPKDMIRDEDNVSPILRLHAEQQLFDQLRREARQARVQLQEHSVAQNDQKANTEQDNTVGDEVNLPPSRQMSSMAHRQVTKACNSAFNSVSTAGPRTQLNGHYSKEGQCDETIRVSVMSTQLQDELLQFDEIVDAIFRHQSDESPSEDAHKTPHTKAVVSEGCGLDPTIEASQHKPANPFRENSSFESQSSEDSMLDQLAGKILSKTTDTSAHERSSFLDNRKQIYLDLRSKARKSESQKEKIEHRSSPSRSKNLAHRATQSYHARTALVPLDSDGQKSTPENRSQILTRRSHRDDRTTLVGTTLRTPLVDTRKSILEEHRAVLTIQHSSSHLSNDTSPELTRAQGLLKTSGKILARKNIEMQHQQEIMQVGHRPGGPSRSERLNKVRHSRTSASKTPFSKTKAVPSTITCNPRPVKTTVKSASSTPDLPSQLKDAILYSSSKKRPSPMMSARERYLLSARGLLKETE